MKYFTPELLARFGSADDKIAEAASEEWERAHEAYVAHLHAIRRQLPKNIRLLLRRFCLHDARVLTMARPGVRGLHIFLQLGTPRDRGILLAYDLASKPEVIHHAVLSEGEVPLEWQYDEIEVVKEGPYSVFQHSILFTGGRELRLMFHGLRWVSYQKMVALMRTLLGGGAEDELEALLT